MTDVNRGPGIGRGTPVETLVTADQQSIVGDGTKTAPLVAVGGGVTSVVADGTSIGGNGTTATPLHTIADGTAVATDGVSIVGNGLAGNPLAAVGGPSGAGVSDGVTLQGTGTEPNPFAIKAVQHDASMSGSGTVAVPLALSIQHDSSLTGLGTAGSPLATVEGTTGVAVDGTTIGGTGKTGAPLHVILSGLDGQVTVAVDGTTISGNGLTGTPLHVDPLGLADEVPALADGITISGNGTTGNPLVALTLTALVYTALGTEGLAFTIDFSPAQANTRYVVGWAPNGMTSVPTSLDLPSTGRTTVSFPVNVGAPLVAGDKLVFFILPQP